MNSSEAHEHFGWLSYQEGFFHEWREEVARKLIQMNPHESRRDNIRAELSEKVFSLMLVEKNKSKMEQT